MSPGPASRSGGLQRGAVVLGHADYSTTLKVYAHLDPKRAKAAAGRIDAALGRSPVAAETAV